MTDELLQEDGWQLLHEGGEEASLNGIEVREGDAAKFSSEMIQDSQDNCTEGATAEPVPENPGDEHCG